MLLDEDPSRRSVPRGLWLVTICAAIALRIALVPGSGFPTDIAAFEDWALALARVGPQGLYADTSGRVFPVVDYPPGYLFVLWAIGVGVRNACDCTPAHDLLLQAAIKTPAMLADFGVAALAYAIAARAYGKRRAFFVAAALLVLPPLWLVSAYWGQVDSVATLLLLAALALWSRGGYTASWIVLAATVLVKPQSIAIAPVLAAAGMRRGGWFARLAAGATAGVALAYASALPFTAARTVPDVLHWLLERYVNGVDKYPNASSGAFNAYTVVGGFFQSDATKFLGVSLRAWGVGFFSLLLLAVAAKTWSLVRGADAQRHVLAAAFVALVALFVLMTRMHERYLMPGLVVGAIVACSNRRYFIAEAIFFFTFTVNCAFILKGFYGGGHHPITAQAGHVLSLLNVAAFVLALTTFFSTRPATSTNEGRF
ncbi:MAG: hypothetical protein NVS3B16_18750 [Vulcanimicrobiaceae bacterium]